MPKIICLECGKAFEHLGSHLIRSHGMNGDEYRESHGLPRGTPLASDEYRAGRKVIFERMLATGLIIRPDQLDLTEAARNAPRPDKTAIDKKRHRDLVSNVRPWDHSRLPAGAKRANGRDADREREYQRAYRAKKLGDDSLMVEWELKYLGSTPPAKKQF